MLNLEEGAAELDHEEGTAILGIVDGVVMLSLGYGSSGIRSCRE
jgi:hypothetical protein